MRVDFLYHRFVWLHYSVDLFDIEEKNKKRFRTLILIGDVKE
jgi:hypothetical protein